MKFDPETVNRISQWKETLTAMPTDQFLDYARFYLGEISTPFNKEKLVDQISAFFCKIENKTNVVSLMGKNDLRIVSLIKLLPEPSKESISQFFSSEVDSFSIRAHLQNLEERMLIFSCKSTQSHKTIYKLNPIIEDALGTKIGIEILIEKSFCDFSKKEPSITLSPLFLSAFISFLLQRPDLCKGDGSIKKKPLKDFSSVFGLDEMTDIEDSYFSKAVKLLINAFRNLHLFFDNEGSFIPDWQRLMNFANMNETQQYIYLSVGAFWNGHSQRNLSIYSQLLMDTILSMENNSYSRKMVMQLGTIIYSLSQNSEKPGNRFEMLMAKVSNEETDYSSSEKLDQIIDAAIAFGLFEVSKNNSDEEILKVSDSLLKNSQQSANQKFVSVEADFSVTIMPGLPLGTLISLVKLMDIKRLDVAAVFEINRKSILRSFDLGMNLKSIEQILEQNCIYSIPQNLEVSLEDWFNTYSSATLYHGYVLKLSEGNVTLVEKNSVLAPHILEKLSPTVLLLDFNNDNEATATIIQSGLSFIGKVKTCSKETKVAPLPLLKKNNYLFSNDTYSQQTVEGLVNPENIIQQMKEYLEEMDLTATQKEGLLSRIERRIVVNKNQLQGESVHFDKTEASAMDNSGKVYIIEKAIQSEDFIEITIDVNALPQIGYPIELDKKNGTVTIRQRNGNEMTLSIFAAVKIKKIPIKIVF